MFDWTSCFWKNMSKKIHKIDKWNLAIILSVMLHMILISFFILDHHIKYLDNIKRVNINAKIMDAVMVDMSEIVQPNDRQNIQSTYAKDNKKNELKLEALKQKKNSDYQNQKDLEYKHSWKKQNSYTISEQQKKIDYIQKHSSMNKISTKEIEKVKVRQEKSKYKEMLKTVSSERRHDDYKKKEADKVLKKQVVSKKIKHDTIKKSIGKVAKNKLETGSSKIVESEHLLDDLESIKNTSIPVEKIDKNKSEAQKNNVSTTDINRYLRQITYSIQSRFYNADLYKGRICELRIKLSPEGELISIVEEGGDSGLCQAAIIAAKQAKLSKPPSDEVYQVFKNVSLIFKPQ